MENYPKIIPFNPSYLEHWGPIDRNFRKLLVTPRSFSWNSWPKVIKLFFMLSLAEHEIWNVHKYKNIEKLSNCQAQVSLECCFSCSSWLKSQQLLAFQPWWGGKFHAQLSWSWKFFITLRFRFNIYLIGLVDYVTKLQNLFSTQQNCR